MNGFKNRYTERHEYTLMTMSGLGRLYRDRGQPEALELLTRVLDMAVDVLGSDNPGTLAATVDVALLNLMAGRLDEAARACERVVVLAEKIHLSDDPNVFGAKQALAQVYNAQQQHN